MKSPTQNWQGLYAIAAKLSDNIDVSFVKESIARCFSAGLQKLSSLKNMRSFTTFIIDGTLNGKRS